MRDLVDIMTSVGFSNVEYISRTGFVTSQYTVGAMFRARKRKRSKVTSTRAG